MRVRLSGPVASGWCSSSGALVLSVRMSAPMRARTRAASADSGADDIAADVSGRIDHMAVDLRRGRLFVAELGNNTVDVVDLAAGRAVHRISGLREPQGIGYAPAADVIAVANAGDGSVRSLQRRRFRARRPRRSWR